MRLPSVVMVLGIVVGALLVVAGGYDDSPGLQLIGVVAAASSLVLGIRSTMRTRRTTADTDDRTRER